MNIAPIQTFTNANRIPLTISDHATIVEIH
jgi:hypothetical protein